MKHRCDSCEATFTRPEHLKRHKTMHSNSKEYPCPFCGKRFARSDALRRHYQSCKSARNVDKAAAEILRRVNRACSSCRCSKVKCSGVQPCERCCSLGQGQACHFTLRKARAANLSSNCSSPMAQATALTTEQSIPPNQVPRHNNSPPEHPHQHDQQRAASERSDSGPDMSPAVDQDVAEHAQGGAAQGVNTDGPQACDQMNELLNPSPELQFDQRTMASPAPPASLTDSFSNDTSDMDFLNLAEDMYFDLDLLDWSILDNSFVARREDNRIDATMSEESPSQQFISPEATMVSPYDIEMGSGGGGGRGGAAGFHLPRGMSLMQISPLDAHRLQILKFLHDSNQGSRRWDHWLSLDNVSLFLSSYFKSFHQHTPLLHLPFWNITATSTRLIFAMILMGAMYSGDLKSNGSEALQLSQMAQTFAWTSDPSLQAGGPAQLDTIQAVYIVTLLDAFYFPSKRYRPPVDTRKLMNEARNAGIFDGVHPATEPWKMKWEEWSAQESRIRTAFILYLFDAIRAVMFDQRPELHVYELCLPLPCDENIFAASIEEEWRELYVNAQDLTRVEYPVILSLFLCHEPIKVPLHFSVMGGFTVLHGILLHMWQQKKIHAQRKRPEMPAAVEVNIREHLTTVQSQVVDNALELWRKHWAKTLSRPGSMACEGLYRDRALAYWFLGNVMNRNRGLANMDIVPVSVNGNWTLKVPRLLRKLTMLMDSGQLDDMSDSVMSMAGGDFDRHLGDLQENVEENADVEGMDTIILGCMMRRERRLSD